MKAEQRRELSAAHIRATNRMGSPFITRIRDIIKHQVNAVASDLRNKGIHAAIHNLQNSVVNEHLHKPIEALYKIFGVYAARKTTAQINKSARQPEVKAGGFGINEELIAAIIAFLKSFIFSKAVVPISQTNRELILARIMEGQQKGWGAEKIAIDLEAWDMPLWRARMLVRTESLFAMQYGRQSAKNHSRWETETIWIAANDHRTRHSHRIVDGETVPEGGRFAVPIFKNNVQIGFDMMIGPGDPHASAGNVINCRCTSSSRAKRDENGKLILKRNISVILPGAFTSHSQIITV